MNIYDVAHVNGDFIDVEADFFEREDDDWVFFANGVEVKRLPWRDVVSVSKVNLRPAPIAHEEPERIWI